MNWIRNHRNLVIIIAAALLVELFSAYQYYYARNMVKNELDRYAESELRIKAVLIKNVLNMMEKIVSEHVWDIKSNISHPDSMFAATARIISNTPDAVGSCIAFAPNYYPEKGELFEPYAYRKDNDIIIEQIGVDGKHDYTTHPAYIKVKNEMEPFWSEPYKYKSDSIVMSLTTYSYPLADENGNFVAICGLDLSLQQIGDTLNANHIYPSSFDLLLTETGDLISGPSDSHLKSHDKDLVVRLLNDSTVRRSNSISGRSEIISFKSEEDGSKGCVYYAHIKGKPYWKVAVVCYDNEVYGDLRAMRLKTVFLMLLGLGVLGFIIHRFFNNEQKLNTAKIEKERISSELRIAQDIQNDMLPRPFGPDDCPDIKIYSTLMPAKEVGGDLYDFFVRNEKLFFCIGDVTGKGVPAAMIMASIHSQFRMASMNESNPSHIMQTLNISSCEGNKTNIFVTLFIGVLDLPTGRLRYCNAGHDIPYILNRSDEKITPLPVECNLPIGLFDDFQYKIQETTMAPNDSIFLYTDGLTEANNKDHKQFGIERLEDILRICCNLSPEEIISKMNEHVSSFVEDAEQSDDLTMLAIRYMPQDEKFINREELRLKNDIKNVDTLNAFVKSMTNKLNIEQTQAHNIKLAMEEAVVNVMDYAYPPGTEGDIVIQAMYNDKKLKFVITDSGIPFDPTAVASADISLSAEARPIGGLGIHLVKKLMDSVNYELIDNKNTLTLIYNI